MDLPAQLIDEVRKGRVVVIFGAGASIGATDRNGQAPPLGDKLRDRLSDQFLGGKFKKETLDYVSDLASSEASQAQVQDFIAEQFRDLQPAPFHHLIPSFHWRGLATTNYDRLIEDVYSASKERVQELVPFLSNSDRVDEKLRSQRHVAYLKLHGCITRTHDVNIPLVLTTEHFLSHRKGRSRLYDILKEWAHENPLVFVGHRLADYDLRSLLLQLTEEATSRPRFYLVRPSSDETEVRFWEQKRVTLLPGSLETFLNALDHSIPRNLRPVLAAVKTGHPIEALFRVREQISESVLDFLTHDADYVHPGMAIDPDDPARFYRGFDVGWYAVERALDVRRSLTEVLLREIIIRPEEDRPSPTELYVLKAEAGAGKSVFLRRLAWESARDAEALCIYVKRGRSAAIEPLLELARCTGRRIFLFWDDAADRVREIQQLANEGIRRNLQLTIFTAERVNTWNMACEDLDQHLTGQYILRYLNHSEIERLVALLLLHRCLGERLERMSPGDRIHEFEERAGRQILVALHEATLGRPFEEILLNEFKEIEPDRARQLYLTVCALNRLNVPVRAGLISRVHGIPFSEFREKFFGPLEHVVQARRDEITRDYAYFARHPEIAQIVFEQVLQDPRDRYHEYVRVLQELNLAYSSDQTAFRQMIRARSLHDMFPSHEDVVALHRVALQMAPDDAYVLQQVANYERLRPNGNLVQARDLLERARQLNPRDPTLLHTLAEVIRSQAMSANSQLMRERLRKEARAALAPLLHDDEESSYANHTMVKLAFDDLRERLADPSGSERDVDAAIREAERVLLDAMQRHPDEEMFLAAEADLSSMLKDNDRALKALQGAFSKNPRDPFIASRLATIYEARGEATNGLETLRNALSSSPGDRVLNFRYAKLLRKVQADNRPELLYHYRRSFTKWDHNYEAQFWFARYAFESDNTDDREQATEVFRRLRQAPMKHEHRVAVQDTLLDGSQLRRFAGSIARVEAEHGFVQRDGLGDWIFFHQSNQPDAVWPKLRRNTRVSFGIAFSFGGAQAIAIECP